MSQAHSDHLRAEHVEAYPRSVTYDATLKMWIAQRPGRRFDRGPTDFKATREPQPQRPFKSWRKAVDYARESTPTEDAAEMMERIYENVRQVDPSFVPPPKLKAPPGVCVPFPRPKRAGKKSARNSTP